MDSQRPMKPALIILAVIACLAITGLLTNHAYQRHLAVEESNALVMTVTTDVLVNWNPQTVRQHADEALLASETAEQTTAFYTPLSRRLGALQEIYDIRYEVDMPSWWQPYGEATASYSMLARFESEVATIRIRLVRQQNRWLITEFNIQPPAIPA